MSGTFTLRLPLLKIFDSFMVESSNKTKLIYLRYIFETLFKDQSFKIDNKGILSIEIEYAKILDEACDMLYNTPDEELSSLSKDDVRGFVDYYIFSTDDHSGVENFEHHDDTRMFMFMEIGKYFDDFFEYPTSPSDHLIIAFNYQTLMKFKVESDDIFERNVKNTIMNYTTSRSKKKMSLKAYERYMELVNE